MYIRYTFIYEVLFKLSFFFSCPFPFPFQYKTGAYLLQMGDVTLRWHTPLSRPFNRGRLRKNQGRTMQNCRKQTGGPKKKTWKMEQHKPKVQVKTYMELSNTRLVHIYFLHMRCASLKWHTPLSRPFNRGRLCKNQGRTMQNCRKQTGGPKKNNGKWSSTSQK